MIGSVAAKRKTDMQKTRSNYHYRGRIITLLPQMEGYMWACQFVIMRSGRTEMDGTPGNTYLSREAPEQAALSTVKTFIDQCKLDKDPFLP
jgi:hypothetical protein